MRIILSKDIPDGSGSHSDTSTFVIISSPAGKEYRSHTSEGKILYNGSGTINLTVEGDITCDIGTGEMIFIPPLCSFTAKVHDASTFYIYKLSLKDHFTESTLPLQSLYDQPRPKQEGPGRITAHEQIVNFFTLLGHYVEDGITTHLFYFHKAKELLFLMKSYYTEEELASFFSSLATYDHEFSDFVLANYRKHRTVQDLAEASYYSLSAFNKIFRKTFSQSPYSWIKQQRANDIYNDLITTNTSVKEISTLHGFHSLSQFTNFCKSQFGVSPRRLRELHGTLPGRVGKIKPEL